MVNYQRYLLQQITVIMNDLYYIFHSNTGCIYETEWNLEILQKQQITCHNMPQVFNASNECR